MIPSRKSDQDISKFDSYQTIYLPKIRLKADPNSISFWSKSDLFHKLTINIKCSNFYLKKKVCIQGNFLVMFCFVWKAEQVNIRLFDLLRPKADFSGKKRANSQFRSFFSKKV